MIQMLEDGLIELKSRMQIYKEIESLEVHIAKLRSQKIELLRDIANHQVEFVEKHALQAKLLSLLGKTSQWAEVRNRCFHGNWSLRPTGSLTA